MHFSFLWFLEAVPWCVAVVLAFAGWGDLLLLALRQPRPWLVCFAAGLPLLITIGGLLNLLQLIRGGIVLFIVLAGAAWALAKLLREKITLPACWRGTALRAGTALLILLCAVLLFIRLSASVHRIGYQVVDDLNEYLVFPLKMLQTHHYAADPFSERRIINSVGPAYFLQAFLLAALPLNSMQMADTAVGLLLLIFFLLTIAAQWKLPPIHTAVTLFFALITLQSTFNLSFTTLPSALIVAMAALLCSEDLRNHPLKLGLLLGGLAGAITGLKSVYLPHVVLFCAIFFALQLRTRGLRYSLTGLAASAAGLLAVLAPWMIAMRSTSGTFFYPILGKGFHYDSYYKVGSVQFVRLSQSDMERLLLAAIIELLLLWHLRKRHNFDAPFPGISAVWTLVLASIAGTIALFLATGGDATIRYNAPCFVPAELLLYPLFAVFVARYPRSIVPKIALGFSLIPLIATVYRMGISVAYNNGHPGTEAGSLAHNFTGCFRYVAMPNEDIRQDYAALEKAIPENSITLTTLTTPYYLDYSDPNKTIYLAGFPGAASLPTGWPIYGTADDLSRYLLGHSIRYLAYSYADGANDPESWLLLVYNLPYTTAIVKNEDFLVLQAHRQYADLAKTRKHIYDDGRMYLLDLAQPMPPASQP
jgi:hypothetical protein